MEEQGKQQEIEIEEVTVQENVIAVRDLVPMRAAMDDSMERIADMKDQFSQTIDPILRMYNAAMCATTARLEIIEDEFKYRKLRCPIHHIDTRLKSAKSILGKLQKKDLDLTLSAACNNIYDIAGIRVVCSYIKDVYLIRDRLMAQDDIMIMQIKDYIETPKENGYRSLHMVIRVPVYFMNKKQLVPVELQIRTLAMDLWASLEHDIKYKCLYQAETEDFSEELKECSRLIYEAEEKMEIMNRTLEAKPEARAKKGKQNPVEKEWAAVVKAEERFLRHAMPARTAGWQEKITRYVPQKLEATLHTAFYKAFELIFDKGTPVIEKTCQKEKKEQNYKINAYTAEVRDTRHALRAFGREAGASRNLNLAVSAVEGVGMGFLGLGLPDIPLFLGVLLKSIYEVALSYGYTYDTQEEQIFILKLIETALSHGEQLAQNNMELNLWMREERTFSISRNEQIRRTSDALARELLYLKFVQGLPVVGMVGGVSDMVYQKRISDYASIKYKRRFLETKRKTGEEKRHPAG